MLAWQQRLLSRCGASVKRSVCAGVDRLCEEYAEHVGRKGVPCPYSVADGPASVFLQSISGERQVVGRDATRQAVKLTDNATEDHMLPQMQMLPGLCVRAVLRRPSTARSIPFRSRIELRNSYRSCMVSRPSALRTSNSDGDGSADDRS